MLYVEECLEKAFLLAEQPPRHVDEERYREAYFKSLDAVRLRLELPVVAVQGPPGSGKTYIVERLAEEYIAEEFWNSDDIIFYVAPTNELAFEACIRVLARILARLGPSREERCRQVRDMPHKVRLLGYKIRSRRQPALKSACGDGVEAGLMSDLTIDEYVRLVFTTEFQRPFIKQLRRDVKLIVDESSKSPYFRAFIPIVRKIVEKGYKDYPVSLVALGDPQQAITVESYGRHILLMNVMKERLGSLAPDNYIMLDRTFRLPAPSEVPISMGYYDGELKAKFTGQERLGELSFNSRDILNALKYVEDVAKTDLQRVVERLEEAINSKTPLVILNTSRFKEGDTLDPGRAKIAYYAALALDAWLRKNGYEYGLAVTSIYTDPPMAVSFEMGRRGRYVERLTVQSMIGGERDFIITMLGKEYSTDAYEEYATLYAREPELLNVQLSRHRRLQVVVGCVSCLAKFKPRPGRVRDERIKTTGETMLELMHYGKAVFHNFM